jgi:hypothetical protein
MLDLIVNRLFEEEEEGGYDTEVGCLCLSACLKRPFIYSLYSSKERRKKQLNLPIKFGNFRFVLIKFLGD